MSKKKPPLARPFLVTVALGVSAAGCGGQIIGPNGGCPESTPSSGSACPGDGTCTYSDGCGSPITATCAGGVWSVSYEGTCNPPPPQECPLSVPSATEYCWEPGFTCTYTDECGQTITATCDGSVFQVSWPPLSCNPPPPVECPLDPPTAGAGCAPDVAAYTCDYVVDTACGPTPLSATCDLDASGLWSWSISAETCTPATPQCALYASAGACELDTTCRWLEPASCPPSPESPLAPAGCFPVADCTAADCAAGTTCVEVLVNPCWDSLCDACAAPANVCL